MVVTAVVNDENRQEQETITSCDHDSYDVKNCQSRNLKVNGNNDSMSDVALTEHLYDEQQPMMRVSVVVVWFCCPEDSS